MKIFRFIVGTINISLLCLFFLRIWLHFSLLSKIGEDFLFVVLVTFFFLLPLGPLGGTSFVMFFYFAETLLLAIAGVYFLKTTFRGSRSVGIRRYIPLVLGVILLIFFVCRFFMPDPRLLKDIPSLTFWMGTRWFMHLLNSALLLWDFKKNRGEHPQASQ